MSEEDVREEVTGRGFVRGVPGGVWVRWMTCITLRTCISKQTIYYGLESKMRAFSHLNATLGRRVRA